MYNNDNDKGKYGNFPDPFAHYSKKISKGYGLKYAKAVEKQWGNSDDERSLFRRRLKDFETNRDYANGTQDTSIYKQILNSLDPNNGDGTLLNLDWSPVPIVPKFVKIVVNNILSRKPYPNVRALDPLSQSEKDDERAKKMFQVKNRELIAQLQQQGVDTGIDVNNIPETPEEAEIFMDTNIKTAAEIAAQVGTNITLEWNDFDQRVYRRAVNDLVTCGMGVIKRNNTLTMELQKSTSTQHTSSIATPRTLHLATLYTQDTSRRLAFQNLSVLLVMSLQKRTMLRLLNK